MKMMGIAKTIIRMMPTIAITIPIIGKALRGVLLTNAMTARIMLIKPLINPHRLESK